MKKITILLVDDHRLLRESLCSILNNDGRFHLIGDTGEGTAAINLFKTLKPDIVLLDLYMSPVDGFDVVREICGDDHRARVIGLSINSAVGFVKRLLDWELWAT